MLSTLHPIPRPLPLACLFQPQLVCSSLDLPEGLAYDIYAKSTPAADADVDGKAVITDGSVTAGGVGVAIEEGDGKSSGGGNADDSVGGSRGITTPSATLTTSE